MKPKNKILVDFGKKIKQLRIRKNLTQDELANLAKVHRTYVGMVERGEKNITLITIHKFLSALNINITELINEE